MNELSTEGWINPPEIKEVARKVGQRGGTVLVQECNSCGKHYERYPKCVRRFFCSRACYMQYRNEHFDHPTKHGKHWSRKKRFAKKALEVRGVPLDVCERCALKIDNPKYVQFHHKDRDEWNNTPENVEVLCVSCHGREHYQDRKLNTLGQFV